MENNLNNIKYYGIAFDQADILDFASDFLAGVRANHFNSDYDTEPRNGPSATYARVKSIEYTYVYCIRKGEAMQWELYQKLEDRPEEVGALLQKSVEIDSKTYCVNTYNRLGFICKKIYFDFEHNWLKTEYFCNNDNKLSFVIKPVSINGNALLEKESFKGESQFVSYLYPKLKAPSDKDYSILAYTDRGFVYFNSVPNSDLGIVINEELCGFVFNLNDFARESQGNSYDVRDCDYLIEVEDNKQTKVIEEKDNIISDTPQVCSEDLNDEIVTREEILQLLNFDPFNKNNDEVGFESEATSEVSCDDEVVPEEQISQLIILDKDDEDFQYEDALPEVDDVALDENELQSESQDFQIQYEEPELENYISVSEENPDTIIRNNGQEYKYYGSMSENLRDGYGRTVTADGHTAYEGNYKDDKRNGFGVFYYGNGEINYLGNWQNNTREGFGVGFRNSDFTAHIGKWNNNTPDGIGARFDKNGDFMFLGNYAHGKKQGLGITVDDEGNFVVSKFRDDEVVSTYSLNDIFPDVE